jgi:RimJ/RimL family protein N-acetyltransferase
LAIDTARLRIRGFRPAEDAEAMTVVYTDPVVMRFIPGGPLAGDAVEPMLVAHVAENVRGLGFHAIFETGEREIGWTLAQEFWGRGYATEAARALLAPTDVAVIDAENAASIRVAERLGLTQREVRTLHGKRHLVFAT